MRRYPQLKIFAMGLGVRLVGLWLIWVGNGHDRLWRKALVVIGVVLSVAGIGVLKYLLYRVIGGKERARTELIDAVKPE